MRGLGLGAREIGTLTGARTTPEAPDLQRLLAAAREARDAAVAMEVSSHALSQGRVDGTRFRAAGFTNLGVDHLDHHGSIEEYYQAKRRLFSSAFTDLAVIDTRGPFGAPGRGGRHRGRRDRRRRPRVGHRRAAVEPVHVAWTPGGPSLGGMFNVANALMAAELVAGLGHDPVAIAAALGDASAVPGRFEAIDEGQPFTVVVDCAHTPDGLEAVLAAARR
ncbi:MAG: Mur ligase family protein [Acidimicrobiales bacterium]